MRTLLVMALLAVFTSNVKAQDPAAQAAQQAQQAAMQAQQQTQQMEDNQHAIDRINQQMAQNAANAAQNTPGCCFAMKPTFSVKAGTYNEAKQVRIKDRTRGAIIYYTTDGWTPTIESQRYEGPITIDRTTKLQAIAIAPYGGRSLVANAEYTINLPNVTIRSASTAVPSVPTMTEDKARPPVISVDRMNRQPSQNADSLRTGSAVLSEGTPVILVFVSNVSSKTAEVGDKIELKLAEDVKVGDLVLVAKGASAEGVVTQVDRTGIGGAPGDIAFRVKSLNANGTIIKLQGSQALEGDAKPPNAAVLIPVIGDFEIFRHGKDAEIKAGTPMTAYVAEEMVLTAQNQANGPAN